MDSNLRVATSSLERTRRRTLAFAITLLIAAAPTPARAQNADSATAVRTDEILVRIRRLTSSDVAAARVLADSLVTSLPTGSTALPAALFAKASIAPSAAEAERDYERIVNDFRFAPQVPDALMRLGLLESARNNRSGALKHLDRLLRDHSDAPVRSRASLLAGRLRMEAGDPARACELLAAAYASAGPTERDVRDQAESIGASCPTPIAQMAQRDPPPMGVMRAPRENTTSAVAVVPATGRSRTRTPAVVKQDTSVKPATASAQAAAAPAVRHDSALPVATAVTPPAPPAPVVKRDTVVTQKPTVAPAAHRDTAPSPKPAPQVVKRDTVVTAMPVAAPVVKRDTAPPPKPVAPTGARRDTATASKSAVRRDTAPTPKPVAVAPPKPLPTAPVMPSAHTDSASPGAASTTRYGVQFAAYNDRPGADKFAAILRGRGITARVEGDAAPFRVRAGRFPTRAEAEASAALWRRPGQPAIVVTLAPTP